MKWICEIGSNHNGLKQRFLEICKVAKRIGCDAVKLQYIRSSLFSDGRKGHIVVDPSFLNLEIGIELGLTVFRNEDIDEVESSGAKISFYKISSYDILRDDLISHASKTRKPLIISTGMATLEEIRNALFVAKTAGAQVLTVLHCVSLYPTHTELAGLASIPLLRGILPLCSYEVGYSDHTRSPQVLYRVAHRYDPSVIEFHLDIDGEGAEFKAGHCWLPHEIEEVIKSVKTGVLADGDGTKALSMGELEERNWRADPGDGLRPIREFRD